MKKSILFLLTLSGCVGVETGKTLSCNNWKTHFEISGSDYEYAEKLAGGKLDCKKLGDLIANHYDKTKGENITVGTLQQIIKDNNGVITKKILKPKE